MKEATSRLETQIARIDHLHADALGVTEPTSHGELESLVASTSSLINTIRANLERLGSDAKKGGPDAKKKVTLVNAQRRRLQERVQKFQTTEKVYRDKMRDRAVRQYRIGNPSGENELKASQSRHDRTRTLDCVVRSEYPNLPASIAVIDTKFSSSIHAFRSPISSQRDRSY